MKNNSQHFPSNQLNQLLANELPANEQLEIETHLEECVDCRTQLESLVADPHEWKKAQHHLSESDELQPFEWMANQQTVSIMLTSDSAELEYEIQPMLVDSKQPRDPFLDPPTHPELLGRIDDFEVEKVIGRGGCGVVYKAFDRELNRPVAIKVLAPQLASCGIARQRFSREARAAAAVVHPNVVPIHGVNSGPERPYIVMSLVNGRSLEAHVRETGPLDLKDVVRISQQIAAGLAAAHRQGLIHRDIKPANILLEQDVSRVMITDFGLARAADDAAITQTGWLAGTPHYMSPEQAKGTEIDQRSDLFSLGSLIYFMATGREPFRAEKPFAVIQKILNENPEKPRCVNSDVSKTLEQIIVRLLAKNPRDRFQSAEDVQQTLEQYLAHLQNPLASPKPKRILPKRKHSVPVFLGICAAILLFGGAWYAISTNAPRTIWPTTNIEPIDEESPAISAASPDLSSVDDQPLETAKTNEFLSDDEFETQIDQLDRDITRLEAELSDPEVGPAGEPTDLSIDKIFTNQAIDNNRNELNLSPSGLNQNNNHY